MSDLISRQAAFDALWKALYKYKDKTEKQFQYFDELDAGDWFMHRIFVQNMSDIDRQVILELPSVQPDLSGYSDRLWKAAYERGKAEAQRTGKWINCDGSEHWKCDKCGCRAERKEGEGDADALRNVSRGTVGVSDGNSNRKVRGENTR